jgi:hypothetical protein
MRRRFAIAFAAVLLIAPFAVAPALAGPKVVREAVVSTLSSNGDIVETTVAQLLHLKADIGGDVELRVPKSDDLDSYRNLSGFRGASGEGDDIVWKAGDELDARALARFDGDLPLDVAVRYYMNDIEMTADEMKRRSGDVRIEIDLENVSGDPKTLEYKAVTSPFLTSVVNQYMPLEYIVRVEFPMDRWSNVGGQGVRVASDLDKEIASTSGILSPPLTDAEKTLVFEGRSDDILTPRIQIFAVPGLSQDAVEGLQAQFEALRALYGGVGSVNENLQAIYDGTVELVDGVEEMIGGVGANDENGNPVIDLDADGLPTTLLGTLGFLSGALNNDVLPNIGEVDEKTGEGVIVTDEKGKTTTLLGGLQSQKETYDDKLIPGMETLIAGMDQLIGGLEDGSPALIDGLEDLEAGVAQLIGSLQTNDLGDPGLREGLILAGGGIDQLLAALGTIADPPNTITVIGALETMQLGLDQLVAGVQQLAAGATDLLTGLTGPGGFRDVLLSLQLDIVNANILHGALDPLLFGTMVGKVAGLADALGDGSLPPDDTTIIGGVQLLAGGVGQVLTGLQSGDVNDPGLSEGVDALVGNLQTNNPLTPGFREGMLAIDAGLDSMLAGLGNTADPATPLTVIGALKLMLDGLGEAAPGASTLVDTVLDALGQMKGGLTNPQFTKEQEELDGQTPKEYFQDCPACFDPDHKLYDPATADPAFQPSFLEVFDLFSEGIDDALPQLHSFDEDAPGLVDGLGQIADGLDTLGSELDKNDPDDPGLVDAIELVRGGLQQVNQGLFAVGELGVRVLHGTVGDLGDEAGRTEASLTDKAAESAKTSVLGADADVVSATYVFDLPAQTTAANDNLRRGALMSLSLAGTALLARRMRRLDV